MKHGIAAALIAVTLTACGPSVRVDSLSAPGAPIRSGQTYAWRAGSGGVAGDLRTADNPMLDETIREIIDEELQARGFVRTDGAADLGVAYVAAVDRELSVTEIDQFFRYRRATYLVPTTEVREFDLGSLILDISDGSSGDLWWRGSAEAELHRTDPGYRADRLRAGVVAILDQLPTG